MHCNMASFWKFSAGNLNIHVFLKSCAGQHFSILFFSHYSKSLNCTVPVQISLLFQGQRSTLWRAMQSRDRWNLERKCRWQQNRAKFGIASASEPVWRNSSWRCLPQCPRRHHSCSFPGLENWICKLRAPNLRDREVVSQRFCKTEMFLETFTKSIHFLNK